ncbi:sensor histidine kinase [Robertkochia solimangrovi]|uniref:sensor histidine kinase n=1 Tax=Robertkochia solimangrovi TaxID=2213046 RepID=UPI00117DFD2E|nr:sensor histidine kinase [Robertkochia solimangrovi]TRZ41281.1 sensor histidine kinase [Robertkochia solimangrovi]
MIRKFTIRKKIFIHLWIWIAVITMFLLQSYFDRGVFPVRLITVLTLAIGIFYLNYAVLVPKFLLQKKAGKYFLAVLLVITAAILVDKLTPFNDMPHRFRQEMSENFSQDAIPPDAVPPNMREMMPRFEEPGGPKKFIGFDIMFPLFFNLVFIVIGTSVRIYEEWNRNELKKQEIENKNKTAELHYLKHQLNPHFLFNSLNSIYSLTSKRSPDAPEAVITLSELMRYMLDKNDNDYVLLKDELEYIRNYMKLQRLRIANNANVTINIHGNVLRQRIRPLLLISFIENAFKYGTDFMGNTEIKIVINIEEDVLYFKCVNIIGNSSKNQERWGIGLVNTRERLELLYPEKHELTVMEENGKFIVDLTLTLV